MILSKLFEPLSFRRCSNTFIYRKPWADAESPRTKTMWEDYDKYEFPVSPEDENLLNKLRGIYIYVRKTIYRKKDGLN
jgi:hypothetical protein